MRKEELLERIHKTRSEIESISAAAKDQLESLPGPQSGWTAKDVFAHLTFWEHRTLDRLRGKLTGDSWGDVDALNSDLLGKSRETPIDRVISEFIESGKRLITEIQSLTEEQLQKESPWKDGRPLWEHLADDSCDHYQEHLGRLQKWAASLNSK